MFDELKNCSSQKKLPKEIDWTTSLQSWNNYYIKFLAHEICLIITKKIKLPLKLGVFLISKSLNVYDLVGPIFN